MWRVFLTRRGVICHVYLHIRHVLSLLTFMDHIKTFDALIIICPSLLPFPDKYELCKFSTGFVCAMVLGGYRFVYCQANLTYLAPAAALSPWEKLGRRQRKLSLCKWNRMDSLIKNQTINNEKWLSPSQNILIKTTRDDWMGAKIQPPKIPRASNKPPKKYQDQKLT